jgi:hypothetical protein
MSAAHERITVEEVLWTCGCGTPMGLEVNGGGCFRDLECRQCGLVASISVRVKPIKMFATRDDRAASIPQ